MHEPSLRFVPEVDAAPAAPELDSKPPSKGA